MYHHYSQTYTHTCTRTSMPMHTRTCYPPDLATTRTAASAINRSHNLSQRHAMTRAWVHNPRRILRIRSVARTSSSGGHGLSPASSTTVGPSGSLCRRRAARFARDGLSSSRGSPSPVRDWRFSLDRACTGNHTICISPADVQHGSPKHEHTHTDNDSTWTKQQRSAAFWLAHSLISSFVPPRAN